MITIAEQLTTVSTVIGQERPLPNPSGGINTGARGRCDDSVRRPEAPHLTGSCPRCSRTIAGLLIFKKEDIIRTNTKRPGTHQGQLLKQYIVLYYRDLSETSRATPCCPVLPLAW